MTFIKMEGEEWSGNAVTETSGCLSANELQRNSNASPREDYIPQILTVLLEILRFYI